MRIVLILLLATVMLLKGLYIYLINDLATGGDYDLVHLQSEVKQYRIENMTLFDEYLHDAALTTINQKARAQGYVDANVIYLQ
jgi:hypothetical protein